MKKKSCNYIDKIGIQENKSNKSQTIGAKHDVK